MVGRGGGRRKLRAAAAPFLCRIYTSYFEEIRVFKAGVCLDTAAWNNGIGLASYFVGLEGRVMINRGSWGHWYLVARGEILGFTKD